MNKPKKPQFRTQNSLRIKRLSSARYRRPKGLHSKIRLNKKGNPKLPSSGYRAPKEIRFAHDGVHAALVSSLSQLESISEKAIIVASSVGKRKKLEIVNAAASKNLRILNLDKDFTKNVESELATRKKSRADLKKKRTVEEKPKKEKKAPAEKAKAPEKDAAAEKKEAQKEMEKVITKRE